MQTIKDKIKIIKEIKKCHIIMGDKETKEEIKLFKNALILEFIRDTIIRKRTKTQEDYETINECEKLIGRIYKEIIDYNLI